MRLVNLTKHLFSATIHIVLFIIDDRLLAFFTSFELQHGKPLVQMYKKSCLLQLKHSEERRWEESPNFTHHRSDTAR